MQLNYSKIGESLSLANIGKILVSFTIPRTLADCVPPAADLTSYISLNALLLQGNTLPENVAQLAIGRLPDVSDQGIPADFSWQTYLSYHPELRGYGITTQLQCEEHYIRQGRSEGRIYKRLDLTLRYSVCHGFINQHYSHIAAFSLARMLGAEIVLPTGCKRDSFGSAFSTDKVHCQNLAYFSVLKLLSERGLV
jgi:hypothetical protein